MKDDRTTISRYITHTVSLKRLEECTGEWTGFKSINWCARCIPSCKCSEMKSEKSEKYLRVRSLFGSRQQQCALWCETASAHESWLHGRAVATATKRAVLAPTLHKTYFPAPYTGFSHTAELDTPTNTVATNIVTLATKTSLAVAKLWLDFTQT